MIFLNIPSTVTEQIENAENLELSYRTLHGYALLDYKDVNKTKIEFPFKSLTNKYKDFLSTIIIQIPLTEEEQEKYKFKPKMVSEELYGTTEFWDQILILNNAFSIIDFKPKVLKVYDPERLKLYLNEIMILEENIYDN